MQPDLNEINKKYMGKNDQESMYKRQEETNEVYSKYGVSPFGSCLPLLIQLPLLMALYQVIYHIPGYIERVADVFSQLATKIFSISGGTEAFVNFVNTNNVRITVGSALTKTNVIDGLSALTTNQWQLLAKVPEFSTITQSLYGGLKEYSTHEVAMIYNLVPRVRNYSPDYTYNPNEGVDSSDIFLTKAHKVEWLYKNYLNKR